MTAQKQIEIADKARISASFYSDILHGRRVPSATVAERLEQATDVKFKAWLMPHKYFNQLVSEKMGPTYPLKDDAPTKNKNK
jgi:transcriptional regulator with XRE-family HTH domain